LFVCCWCALTPLLPSFNAHAQGQATPVVLNTLAGQPLLTESVSFFAADTLINPALRLDFGFATDEVFQPGGFHDSFSLTVQGNGLTLALATLDASGVVWAPLTPGTTPIDEESMLIRLLPKPSDARVGPRSKDRADQPVWEATG